ncbi:selenophosphate-dependent tRNA 2-selenouridine synthase [Hydrogenimonas sp.]|nr:selenophosphate-dependent tRNA 2-selenouridine synthase [Hydrogenimonas sp.]
MGELFDDFRSIVKKRLPLIDVRAPVEYEKGAFPGAVNLPLMSDEERRLVGIRYKERGNAEALKLGHELVSGEIKKRRIEAWCSFVKSHPKALLYCFRGGQRSQISQEWMALAGCPVPRLRGGYKAFRRYLIDETERIGGKLEPIILGGRTGSGKTLLLEKIAASIDLEALANHRGSAFGRKISPQPTQISFENRLAYDLIEKTDSYGFRLVFEDEGRNVGRLYLPQALFSSFGEAPLVILQTPMDRRVEITWREYVADAQREYLEIGSTEPLLEWKEAVSSAMDRIKRRLGGERHARVKSMLQSAFTEQIRSGSAEPHKEWVEYLLREYYDPMYDYQIEKRARRVVFTGDSDSVMEYLQEALSS